MAEVRSWIVFAFKGPPCFKDTASRAPLSLSPQHPVKTPRSGAHLLVLSGRLASRGLLGRLGSPAARPDMSFGALLLRSGRAFQWPIGSSACSGGLLIVVPCPALGGSPAMAESDDPGPAGLPPGRPLGPVALLRQ